MPYARPTGPNLKQSYMHLTNYAINKESASFIYNEDAREDDQGHKRSLNSVFGDLEDMGVDIDTVWDKI